MALLSPQGAWLRVNEALCKLLGYSASELLATTFRKVTHPDDRDASLQQLRRLLAGEMNHYETETRYLRRSRAVMWGLLSVSLGRTAEGTPELFIVQIVDLTERNAAERREASLRSTESTKHGQPVEVSGVVQDITQRRKLEDTFRFLAQHSGASDGEGFFRPLARYLARALDAECICVDRLVGDGRSAETLAAFRDGSFDDDLVYALEGTPCGVAIGQDVCVFPADVRERFPLDVALQALGAEALRISNQLLEASQSIAKVGGWELDLVTKKLFWTAETYRLHDISPAEFNPTVDAGVGYFLPESRRVISAALEAAMERGEGYDLVLETLTTKGRRIDVRTTCEVTMHDGGRRS